ncbi:[Wnt protein] O-palmitoleoyl-L-serine hydrolase [Salvia divinorum]|uniref:Pectin acetylesterase n=1 Tax=Salvia divinorum TaxID=28513 RepID=A0ABD1HSP6_SALDI
MGNHSQVTVAPWLKVLVCLLIFVQSLTNGQDIEPILNVTYIKDGVAKGAVCLDGSPGAYYFGQGFEDGVDNWIIYLPGGAWCYSEDNCLIKSKYNYTGTTKYAAPISFFTFLSRNRNINPVKCVSDSGFFIRGKDLPGASDHALDYFSEIVKYHELAKYLPKSCTRRMAPELCFFPENVVNDIETPLFLLNSDFDTYQMYILVVPNPPMDKNWNCTKNFAFLSNCTADQLHIIMDFQTMFLKTLEGLDDDPSRGLFITSCYNHGISDIQQNWQGLPTLQNKTVQEAIGDWYFERNSVQFIDHRHWHPIDCSNTK